jgi:hypothetical protein
LTAAPTLKSAVETTRIAFGRTRGDAPDDRLRGVRKSPGGLHGRESAPHISLEVQLRKDSMSRNLAFVLVTLLGSMVAPLSAYAQLTPPAGSAGAGNSPISGIPFGPANPSVISDPSGLGNASRVPPLGRNPPPPPPPPVVSGPVGSPSPRVAAPYAGASERIFSADEVDPRKLPARPHGRPQLRHFTGICRGC